ncbi:hypothetical protein A6R70_14585 [Agrobacterium rubi]|uniref:hypothetical protein n=1 Tax=Agrobacterium rubi TaxID=28099 RepID=UPI00201B5895|nr:hypothetical protein [Agrobacterium rubi]MCL6653516.1 hypothetical protein [Agrobacterium rubi]
MSRPIEIFWMVYGLHQKAPTARHKTEQSAIDEAKRLARMNPEVDFYVLETIHHAVKREVDVTFIGRHDPAYPRSCLDDDIPF